MAGLLLDTPDVRFLIDLARSGPEPNLAARVLAGLPLSPSARRSVQDLTGAVGEPDPVVGSAGAMVAETQETPAPEILAAVSAARDALFGAELPLDVRYRLHDVPVEAAVGLLTELVEELLLAARRRSRSVLDLGTGRLTEIAWELSARGARPVAAFLPDPRAADVPHGMASWADRVLYLVHPFHVVDLARRLLGRSGNRAHVLGLLAEAAPRLGRDALGEIVRPGVRGDWPKAPYTSLLQLLDLARAKRRSAWPATGVDGEPAESRSVIRTVPPRLAAPTRVAPGESFAIEIGLSAVSDAAVEGSVRITGETFRLEMEVHAEGCDVDVPMHEVDVTPWHPHPCIPVTVHALHREADVQVRVLYTVDGVRVGTASRTVRVGGPPLTEEDRTAQELRSRWDLVVGDGPAPDVDIVVLRDDIRRHLHWSCRSRHTPGVAVTWTPFTADDADELARRLDGLDARSGDGVWRSVRYLVPLQHDIGRTVPDIVWQLLRAAHAATGEPPTVLLSSQAGEIPWEIATVPVTWLPDEPNQLGAQAVLGRWPLPYRARGLQVQGPPPSLLRVATMAVAGLADGDLPEAESEVTHLHTVYGAERVELTAEAISDCLCGHPNAEIFHLAAHGSEEGIELAESVPFDDYDVRGCDGGPVQVAFLNACRLGGSRTGLHEDSGLARAFVDVGAGAVVAPLWNVRDLAAARLAAAFYAEVLMEGVPPAEVLRQQRMRGRRRIDRSAYVFVGHPGLRITWSGPSSATPGDARAAGS